METNMLPQDPICKKLLGYYDILLSQGVNKKEALVRAECLLDTFGCKEEAKELKLNKEEK